MATKIRRALGRHTRAFSKTKFFAYDFPFEIIAQILFYASQVHYDKLTQRPKFIVSPFVLCQVSKPWQSYISSNSIFWSQLIISLSLANRMRRTYTQQLYQWLNRTQPDGLDVYIDGYHPPAKPFDPSTLDDIRDFLTTNSSRWRSIDASYAQQTIITMLSSFYLSPPDGLSKQPLRFTLLRTLIIRTSNPSPFMARAIPNDFRTSPALESLQLTGFSAPFSILRPLKFSNVSNTITTLTLSHNCYDPSCSLIHGFPHLVDADFHYEMDYLSCDCPLQSRLPHRRIQSLKISTRVSGSRMNVPSHLQAPALEDLHISVERRRSQNCDLSDISRLLRRSGCHLVRLTLQLALPEECHIVQLLCSLPSLLELHLRDVEPSAEYSFTSGLSRAFFDALHPHARNLILPTLKFLTLGGALAIDSPDAFEGLVLRLRQTWTRDAGTIGVLGGGSNISVAKLQFAKIQADQKGLRLEEQDSLFVSDLKSFMEKDALWLRNSDGSTWT